MSDSDEAQMPMFRAAVVTLFPEMFAAIEQSGITKRAISQGLMALRCFSPRDFALDRHRTVDDRPYGGGPGMVMKVQPLMDALHAAKAWMAPQTATVVYLSPQGQTLNRSGVEHLGGRNLILVAGRYEGIDERFIEDEVDVEVSIGDYVLSGGELPAMVLLDALIRRLPGALGAAQSAEQDSFENGLLDCPHYTRPEELNGKSVPEVLLSGDHQKIANWRMKQSLGRTAERRPELLEKLDSTDAQRELLDEYWQERQ